MPPIDKRTQAAADYLRGDPVRDICLRYFISESTLHDWLRAEGIRRQRLPVTRHLAPQKGPYRPAPRTEKARIVFEAWRADPAASLSTLAERTGASPAYISRLVRHWKAQVLNGH